MEYLDSDDDKKIYWLVFFIIIVVAIVLGYYFVFVYSDNKENDIEVVEEVTNYDDYVGVWVLYTEEDTELPYQELVIDKFDGSTVTFSYYIKNMTCFDSVVGELDDDNSATFEITDRTGIITISGRLTFKNNKVYISILTSSIEDISSETIAFDVTSDESLLASLEGDTNEEE